MTRARLWGFLALVCLYGAAASRFEAPAIALGSGAAPSERLHLAVSLQTLWILVLGISLVAGGSLADDRRSGYLAMLLGRGPSFTQIVASRLCAAVATATLATLSVVATLGLHAAISGTGVSESQVALREAVSFLPGLLGNSPVSYAGVVAMVYGLAAGALLAVSLLIGVLTSAKFLSELGPPLGLLILGFGMTGPLWSLNPLERASFMQFSGVAWTTPQSMLLYWACVLVLASCGAVLVSRWRGAL